MCATGRERGGKGERNRGRKGERVEEVSVTCVMTLLYDENANWPAK